MAEVDPREDHSRLLFYPPLFFETDRMLEKCACMEILLFRTQRHPVMGKKSKQLNPRRAVVSPGTK
ncbi:MAG: hypothetical protein ACREVV_04880 [Steroidobacteraceae bacterium]